MKTRTRPRWFSRSPASAGSGDRSRSGLNDVRRMFDSGQYQQVIAASGAEADPRVTFLRAQSYQKLLQANEARQVYAQLAGRPESDAWRDVGRSALALDGERPGGRLEASNQAIARDGALPEAYYPAGHGAQRDARTSPAPRSPFRRRRISIRTGPMRTTTRAWRTRR